MKDRFDQHLPRGNKVRGTKPTKKLGITMVVLFCLFVGCHGQQAVMKLIAGKKKTFSIYTEGQNRMFYITVPESSIVTCYTTGTSTSGDADLYAKFGSEPNDSIYDVSSVGRFANETVGPLEATTTSARILYVMVYAYTTFNNVQLWCDLTKETTEPSSNPSENPSENPSGNPSENPSENPSSTPTICLAPAAPFTTCSGRNAPAPLCCSGRCTVQPDRCCLLQRSPCDENSECCRGHCHNNECICIGRSGSCNASGPPCCIGICSSGGFCPP